MSGIGSAPDPGRRRLRRGPAPSRPRSPAAGRRRTSARERRRPGGRGSPRRRRWVRVHLHGPAGAFVARVVGGIRIDARSGQHVVLGAGGVDQVQRVPARYSLRLRHVTHALLLCGVGRTPEMVLPQRVGPMRGGPCPHWHHDRVDPVLVVGGGIAGIAAAIEVQRAGRPVLVRDRGRRLGGRMASRTTDGRPVDIAPRTSRCPTRPSRRWSRTGSAAVWPDRGPTPSPCTATRTRRPRPVLCAGLLGVGYAAWWRTWPAGWTSGRRRRWSASIPG